MSEIPEVDAGSVAGNGAGPARPEEPLRLGGMALRNGLLIHGPTSWAIAARTSDGRIEVASGAKPTLSQTAAGRIPLLRGPVRLAEAMAVIPLARLRLRSARLPFEDPMVIVTMAGSTVATRLIRSLRASTVGREALIAVVGILPAAAALRDHDLAAYHGAEHKSIGGYETGTDPAAFPKEHGRCGSNLIGPMLALSIAGQVVVERLFEEPSAAARLLAAIGSTGLAVELFAYAERRPESLLGRAVRGPGYEIQRIVSTREPTPEQMQVGLAALNEVLRAEGVPADTV